MVPRWQGRDNHTGCRTSLGHTDTISKPQNHRRPLGDSAAKVWEKNLHSFVFLFSFYRRGVLAFLLFFAFFFSPGSPEPGRGLEFSLRWGWGGASGPGLLRLSGCFCSSAVCLLCRCLFYSFLLFCALLLFCLPSSRCHLFSTAEPSESSAPLFPPFR